MKTYSRELSTHTKTCNINFDNLLCCSENSSLQDCIDKLILCQPKIEELEKVRDYKAM